MPTRLPLLSLLTAVVSSASGVQWLLVHDDSLAGSVCHWLSPGKEDCAWGEAYAGSPAHECKGLRAHA